MTTMQQLINSDDSILDTKSLNRIAYEQNQLMMKHARLATLKEGTPAHKRCLESIGKTETLIAQIHDSLTARQAKRDEKAAAKASKKLTRDTGAPAVMTVQTAHVPENDQEAIDLACLVEELEKVG